MEIALFVAVMVVVSAVCFLVSFWFWALLLGIFIKNPQTKYLVGVLSTGTFSVIDSLNGHPSRILLYLLIGLPIWYLLWWLETKPNTKRAVR